MNFDVKVDGMYYGSVDDMDTSQQIFIFFLVISKPLILLSFQKSYIHILQAELLGIVQK